MNVSGLVFLVCLQAVPEPPAPAPAPESPAAPDLATILEDPQLQLKAIEVLENEVGGLRLVLDGMIEPESRESEVLRVVAGLEEDLQQLGVTPDRADQVRRLSNDVLALRARLRLLELRAPTIQPRDDGFRPVLELDVADPEAAAADLRARAEAEELPALVTAAGGEPGRSRLPSREAVLAFRAGDLDAVLRILDGLDPTRIAPDALYAQGCALIARGDFDRARPLFERVRSYADRVTLCEAAGHQLTRMERLRAGIVDAAPARAEDP